MIAVAFDQENTYLDPPDGVNSDICSPLPVCRGTLSNGIEVMISCWKLTKEELEIINKTGRVWLMIAGDKHPMVELMGESPFV